MKTSPFVLAALVVAALAPASPARADAAATCQGLPATIVGAPDHAVIGTDGPDVIVAVRPRTVDALAGDDVVCVEGGNPRVSLGGGADAFLATSPGAYKIDTGDSDDVRAGRAPSHDVVTTTTGSSKVFSGAADLPDDDAIELGGWQDSLTVHGVPTGAFDAANDPDAGPGLVDLDQLHLSDPVAHAWRVDETAGTVSVDGAPATRLSGFETVHVNQLAWASLDYTGTAGDDALLATGRLHGRGPIHVALGGGQDTAVLSPRLKGTVDAGPGTHDDVHVVGSLYRSPTGDLDVSLSGTWTYNGRPGVALSGFEDGSVSAVRTARFEGNAAKNVMGLRACTGSVVAGGGNDQVFLYAVRRCTPQHGAFHAYGGPGADYLQGSGVDDVLIGGAGRDAADGEGGHHNRCQAEERHRCQVG